MADQHRFTHHMSDSDALMWNIEKDPILRTTIVAVAVLDRAPDFERLRDRLERASAVIPRLRQRVLSPPLRLGPPRWAVEDDFQLDYHLHRYHLPQPATYRALLDAVAPQATASFDRARPLWDFTVLEGLPDGRAALVMKVHHSLTDGIGGMSLLLEVVDLERDAPEAGERPVEPEPEPFDTLGLVRDSVSHSTRRALGIARRVPGSLAGAAFGAVRDPLGTAAATADTARSITRTLAPASRPMSPIMTRRGLGRHLDTIDVSLDDLKRAAKSVDGSLNDAFVAGIVGGLMRYHEFHGAPVDELRMTMPINLRTADDTAGGNRFVPARFGVPMALRDPQERMVALGALVREWRAEPALALTSQLATVLNRLPTATVTALFGAMLKCSDFTTSNVPGSPIPVWVAGSKVERMYAFAPPSGTSLNVTLISIGDTCCLGVVSDTAAVSDPATLTACLDEGLAEVVATG